MLTSEEAAAKSRTVNIRFVAALLALAEVALDVEELTREAAAARLESPPLHWIAATSNVHDPHGELASFFTRAILARTIVASAIPPRLRKAWSIDGRAFFKVPAGPAASRGSERS